MIPKRLGNTVEIVRVTSSFSKNTLSWHCVKCFQIRRFSCPYFPAFGLNTERYFVSLRIQFKCGKILTRKNSVFGHFSRSEKAEWVNSFLIPS